MSELYNQIFALVYGYAYGDIALDDFRADFADLYFKVRQRARGDSGANALASKIIGPLAELSRGHRDENSFREELVLAIPFRQENSGSNDSDASMHFPVSGNNNIGFNIVRGVAA